MNTKQFFIYLPLLSLFFLNTFVQAGDFSSAMSPAFKFCTQTVHRAVVSDSPVAKAFRFGCWSTLVGTVLHQVKEHSVISKFSESCKKVKEKNPILANMIQYFTLGGVLTTGFFFLRPGSPLSITMLHVTKDFTNVACSLGMQHVVSRYLESKKLNENKNEYLISDDVRTKTKLSDVAGGIPKELESVIAQLKNPLAPKFSNVDRTRAVLLYGPPGTGKTTIAKAIAGELENCAFFNINASRFNDGTVGQAQKQVRELFEAARSVVKNNLYKQALIFVDEFDAVGKRHESQGVNSAVTHEINATINTLLTEIESDKNKGIIVVAATNKKGAIDEAIIRPGRFDLAVEVALPNQDQITQIFKKYLSSSLVTNFSENNYKQLAQASHKLNFSPAGVQQMVTNVMREKSQAQFADFRKYLCKIYAIKKFEKFVEKNILIEKHLKHDEEASEIAAFTGGDLAKAKQIFSNVLAAGDKKITHQTLDHAKNCLTLD